MQGKPGCGRAYAVNQSVEAISSTRKAFAVVNFVCGAHARGSRVGAPDGFESWHAALSIVRTMPHDEIIEQYEITAGELTQWLAQWEHEPTEEPLKKSKS